jgi:hypothetical protein
MGRAEIGDRSAGSRMRRRMILLMAKLWGRNGRFMCDARLVGSFERRQWRSVKLIEMGQSGHQ